MARRPERVPFPGGRRGRNSTAGSEDRKDRQGRERSRTRARDPRDDLSVSEEGSARGRGQRQGRNQAPGRPEPKGVRFSDLVLAKARSAHPDKVGPPSSPEPLARLDYEDELAIKNQALQEFWSAHAIPDKPNRILPSPLPRKYRITTKRRVVSEHGRFRLDFLPEKREAGQSRLGAVSELEPAEHGSIYAFLLDKLNTPAYEGLAQALNFLVIRGDYQRFAVFFNVNRINAQVARKAKLLADHLQGLEFGADGRVVETGSGTESPVSPAEAHAEGNAGRKGGRRGARPAGARTGGERPRVASAWIFHDPERSPFYLDDRAPEGPWKMKRLFGPDTLRLRVGTRAYTFKPTAFAQVNGSILPEFLERAAQLLKPRPEQRLLDLYCGFGFFSLHLASQYREVVGVDAAGPAIESARDMASADKTGRARFTSARIRAAGLARLLPPPEEGMPEAMLLDPPRQGVEPGVIRELSARAPARVLHIFCDMDTLPREVNQWRKCGYMIAKVIPLDMFPGTDNLEVMVAFIPDRYGILNRIEAPARNPLDAAPRSGQGPAGSRKGKDRRTR